MTKVTSYRLTSEAKNDLIEIRRHSLNQWGTAQSNKYISELRRTLTSLSAMPGLGKQRPELAEDAFSFPSGSHVIYYTLHKQQLIVFAVLHKSMVPTNHLEKRNII